MVKKGTADLVIDIDEIGDSILVNSSRLIDNQSLIATDIATVDGVVDSILMNASNLYQSNTTLTTNLSNANSLIDSVKTVTDNLPDSGALTTIRYNQSEIFKDTNYLMEEASHDTFIWPAVGHRCRLYSFGNTTQFCNWTQVNSTGLNYSSLSWITRTDIGNGTCHLTGILIEDVDTSDVIYTLELGWGANKSVIARHRFINPSAGKTMTIQQIRTRPPSINANTTIYYRMCCENSSKYCDLSFRYHYHNA